MRATSCIFLFPLYPIHGTPYTPSKVIPICTHLQKIISMLIINIIRLIINIIRAWIMLKQRVLRTS